MDNIRLDQLEIDVTEWLGVTKDTAEQPPPLEIEAKLKPEFPIDVHKAALLQINIAAEDSETGRIESSLELINKEFMAVTIILDIQLAMLVYGIIMPYMSEEQLEDIVNSKKLAWLTKNMPAISKLSIPWSIVTDREQNIQQAKNDNLPKISSLLKGKTNTALLKTYLADTHNITEAQYKNDTAVELYLIAHIATVEAINALNDYEYIYIALHHMHNYRFLQETVMLQALPPCATLQFIKPNAQELLTSTELNKTLPKIDLLNTISGHKSYLENSMQHFPGHVYVKSLNRTFLSFNKQQCLSLGAADDSYFAGKTFESLFPQNESDELADIIDEITTTNKTKVLIEEGHYLGKKLPFLSIKMLLHNKKNKAVGILGFSMQLEDKLPQCENVMQEIIEDKNHTPDIATLRETITNMPGHVFWQDTNGQILGCNHNQAKFLGYDSPNDLIGKYSIDFLTKEHAKGAQQSLIEIVATGKPIIKEEIYKSANNFMVMISHKTPVEDNTGKVIGIIVVSFDISKIRPNEIQLEQEKEKLAIVNNFKNQFAQTIENDMRTSFIKLRSMIEAYARKESDITKKNNLYDISSCAKDLLTYCDSLSDCSDTISSSNNKTLVSIKDLTNSIINTYTNFIRDKNLEFELCYDESIPKQVIADSYRLKKIIGSLVSNAARYTDQGYIKLIIKLDSSKNSRSTIVFTIIDSGISINENNNQHTITKDCSSSGKCICLNEIKRFVEDLGGTVTIDSDIPTGSSITVTLNFDMPANNNSKKTEPFLEEITTELGCYSKPAAKSMDVLNMLNDKHFDILLLDIGLEDTDGYTLARKIRSLELRQRQQPVKIVVITAQQAKIQSGLAKELNITDYFIEPAEVKELTNTIKDCMLAQEDLREASVV